VNLERAFGITRVFHGANCACLGHGGVPVTKKNRAAESRIPDVLWEEDRLGDDAPIYEGERVVPFGFGRIDTTSGEFEFRIFDHNGRPRYACVVTREMTAAPTRGTRGTPRRAPKPKSKTRGTTKLKAKTKGTTKLKPKRRNKADREPIDEPPIQLTSFSFCAPDSPRAFSFSA
jgi:hypothetical protein